MLKIVVKILLLLHFVILQKGSQKVVHIAVEIGVQSKYSGSLPAVVDCQKDSGSTGENGTQVKPVLLAVKIFAVYFSDISLLKAKIGLVWPKNEKTRNNYKIKVEGH